MSALQCICVHAPQPVGMQMRQQQPLLIALQRPMTMQHWRPLQRPARGLLVKPWALQGLHKPELQKLVGRSP